ncbi:MAG: LCP family protein [Oscillospiraceae bacterium]|jgi:LCP family protein required for cell wall assembly|nr:LCP family protein [Oscillospiraceae bacterium]
MAENNGNDLYGEADEDLLSQIQRWTEKTQHEKAARASAMGEPAQMRNPWAPPELMAAADRALREDPRDGLPPLLPKEAQPMRPAYDRRRRPVRNFLAILLALALLLGAGGYALAFAAAGKADRQPIPDADRAALFAAATGSTRVTNILLLGVDTAEGGRTDTMLLLSVDRVHRKLKLASFLRDSWLTLPDGKAGKLNTAVHQGGPGAVMRAVGENFGVRVDHYAMFDFGVFEQVVDALGGVSVAITDKEADFLCRTAGPFKRMGREEIRGQMEKSGAVKLDGLQALVYCRIRKLDDDFQRTARQRKFMNSLVSACKRNPLRLLGLAGGALSDVRTDMSQAQLANLAAMAPLLLGYKMEEFTVPAPGTWSYATKKGASVVTLDVAENAARLRDFIYGQ